jgi:hypothetical protein
MHLQLKSWEKSDMCQSSSRKFSHKIDERLTCYQPPWQAVNKV